MADSRPGIELSDQLEAHGAERLPGNHGILIRGWKIECSLGHIAGADELPALSARLGAAIAPAELPPLPEAVFAQNWATLTHEASGISLRLDAYGGLLTWAAASAQNGSGGLQVPIAGQPAWRERAAKIGDSASRDFDWTYTSDYAGSAVLAPKGSQGPEFAKAAQASAAATTTPAVSPRLPWAAHKGPGLDMAMLRRTDVPILCFADLVLDASLWADNKQFILICPNSEPSYSDDLHDCGESELRVRLRVMPQCFFILMRHSLRVDGVMIRQHDTRIFHKFGSSTVLRAQRIGQAPLPPLPATPQPSPSGAAAAVPAPLGSLIPNEAQAAERLAGVPPKLNIVEELALLPPTTPLAAVS